MDSMYVYIKRSRFWQNPDRVRIVYHAHDAGGDRTSRCGMEIWDEDYHTDWQGTHWLIAGRIGDPCKRCWPRPQAVEA